MNVEAVVFSAGCELRLAQFLQLSLLSLFRNSLIVLRLLLSPIRLIDKYGDFFRSSYLLEAVVNGGIVGVIAMEGSLIVHVVDIGGLQRRSYFYFFPFLHAHRFLSVFDPFDEDLQDFDQAQLFVILAALIDFQFNRDFDYAGTVILRIRLFLDSPSLPSVIAHRIVLADHIAVIISKSHLGAAIIDLDIARDMFFVVGEGMVGAVGAIVIENEFNGHLEHFSDYLRK